MAAWLPEDHRYERPSSDAGPGPEDAGGGYGIDGRGDRGAAGELS